MKTEQQISTRLAVEKLGVILHQTEEKKKRHYIVKDPVVNKERLERLRKQGWQKGQSGHPEGRPINALSLTAILNQKLREHPEDAEAIVNALIVLGKTKDMRAIEMAFERVDGKVIEKHEISGELPVRIVFVPASQLLAQTSIVEIETKPKLIEAKVERNE